MWPKLFYYYVTSLCHSLVLQLFYLCIGRRVKCATNKYCFYRIIIKNKIMRTNFFLATFLVLISFSLSSCDAIAGIFKAGMWVGVIVVVVVIALVLWLIRKMGK